LLVWLEFFPDLHPVFTANSWSKGDKKEITALLKDGGYS
jgi:hypothetical protein